MMTSYSCWWNLWLSVIVFMIIWSPCHVFLLGNRFDACSYLVNLNCTHHSSGTVCASNRVTYENHCEFSKAICTDNTIKLTHYGPCQHEKIEQELVLGIACESLIQMDCRSFSGTVRYCGTNGITYPNVCYFEKARCVQDRLYLDHFGSCTMDRKSDVVY
ncbi:SPARC-related modular calcium-binding protein 1 [Mactra antiquata]